MRDASDALSDRTSSSSAAVAERPAAKPAPRRIERDPSFLEASCVGKATPVERAKLDRAIERALAKVRELQHADGYWVAELEANATLNAEYIFLHHYMGKLDHPRVKKLAQHLLDTQTEDGSWPLFFEGEGELHATIEAYAALKLAGYRADHPALAKARAFILAKGGLLKARVITRIYLALLGQMDWRATPMMPPQIMFMPSWSRFNIHEMAYWARTCTVPLLILCSLRKEAPVPAGAELDELWAEGTSADDFVFEVDAPFISWKSFFVKADKALRIMHRSPFKPLEWLGIRRAERWIREHQDEPGDWGGILPAMVHSLMALHALGHDESDSAVSRGLSALERLEIDRGESMNIQPCVSPVWDTAWCLMGLYEAGVRPDDAGFAKAVDWTYNEQIFRQGDWAFKAPEVRPGGWAFQFANDFYPDTDDTSVVLMALLRGGFTETERFGSEQQRERWERGLEWLLGMQNEDGGLGAFEREVSDEVYNEILFNDAKNMLDPSTVDVTGRCLEILGRMGRDPDHPVVKRMLDYVLSEQEPDGKWWGRWGVNYVYGTWSALAGLHAIGLPPEQPNVAKAADWLEGYRNDDGGFGESCASYEPGREAEKCPSTPSQTAWALLGLIAAGRTRGAVARDAVQWLIENQRDDGDWDEQHFTGTGFPMAFYLRYHMYRLYFPLIALARYRRGLDTLG